MNKRYNWMTPEEAEKELAHGDMVMVVLGDEVLCGVLGQQYGPVIYIPCYMAGMRLRTFTKICRAIVPEVPSE